MIRPYQIDDRERIRWICCETADIGQPVERLFPDRDIFADCLTSYYTDYEPESLWVVEQEGLVVGYLTGCLNEPRFHRVWILCILPKIIFNTLLKGPRLTAALLRLVGANLIQSLRQKIPVKTRGSNETSAHLHINLLPDGRRKGIGRDLMNKFFEQADRAGLHRIHLGVREDNAKGRTFFERQGFTAVARRFGFRIFNPMPLDYYVVDYERVR